ncbi:MAG: AcrB/AcrD/AcrF family protein [Armatimonadia bacterium]|nr:AcrB/AcrD/AcrF family protein [Armatimonadia bacterium]
MSRTEDQVGHVGIAGGIAKAFINSRLTPIIVVTTIALGAFGALLTPREEEPQIIVPMIDIFVQMPGASAEEVEQRVTTPMEKLLWEIPGVEYIYTTSMPGGAMAIVRFYVNTPEEDALIRTYNKMYSNFDLIPPGASQPLIKLRAIDDVPVLALTFYGEGYDPFELRRVAAVVESHLKQHPEVSQTSLIGGYRRQVRVKLDPERMAGHNVSPGMIAKVLETANTEIPSGSFSQGNEEILVETGDFLQSAEDVAGVVVGVYDGKPVYVRDVAEVVDGAEDPTRYVRVAAGAAWHESHPHVEPPQGASPAVTLAVAKQKGANASTVVESLLEKVEAMRGEFFPRDIQILTTRNYGETAKEKSDELLKHLGIATISVTLLIAIALGWREAGVVLVAVPVTLALTILVFYLFGYTLNRVTLFALIFSIGILVDDAIVVVENIVRHYRMPENRERDVDTVVVEAVDEVGNPTILATFTVIAAILPMAFVRGLMGPYMEPIPVGASAAMLFSLIIAFVISPWASLRLLKREGSGDEHEKEGWSTRLYRRAMDTLIHNKVAQVGFLVGVVVLLLAAMSLVALKVVRVKMLPFDNKSEFQVIIDLPEGSTLEETSRCTREIAEYLRTVDEVSDVQMYVGTAGPHNFNGLVRHYFLRSAPHEADIQVNLIGRHHRKAQSHDIAKRVRPQVAEIGDRYDARIKVAEVPPGPPVLQTLVAEIYGPDYERQREIAAEVLEVFESTEGVVDVDWYVESPQTKYEFIVRKDQAALQGVTTEQIAKTLRIVSDGADVGLAHIPEEKEDVLIWLEVPREQRASVAQLEGVRVMSESGRLVPIGDVAEVRETTAEMNIYHKNLQPVVYVTGDLAGTAESPVYAILQMNRVLDDMVLPEGYVMERFTTHQPHLTDRYAMKWDGEWHITYEVFRDLGLAFAVVLILIYVLVVGWFQDFVTPLIILSAIPFSLVGIIPGHGIMGAFFTATSMIGFIAGAGIVVRNSIILVDFIEFRLRHGYPLDQAVIDAGAVRFRPMLLTAAAVVVGSSVILFDPIFQGLAISLMAGEVASLFLSRVTVPILYFVDHRWRERRGITTAVEEPGPDETLAESSDEEETQ